MDTRKYTNYNDYYKDVRQNLHQLNITKSLDNQAEYLSNLRECDKEFIKYLNHNQNAKLKSVFFTRHGLCSTHQKDYGLAPNATVEDTALIALEKSAAITKNMFSIELNAKSCIAISPMIRARQTASKIIPAQFTDSIQIKLFLTENSSHPSGKPLLNVESLQNENGLMFGISSAIYDQKYFDGLDEKLKQANQLLIDKSITHSIAEDTNTDFDISDNVKIDSINSFIDNQNHDGDIDIWLIGHGKNTQNYFETRYLIDGSLEYCETRKVLHYRDINDVAVEFVTPYSLRINQTTGMFIGCILPPEKKPIIMYSNPVQFLEKYVADAIKKHNNTEALKNTSSFFQDGFNNVDHTKTDAAKHLLIILKGLCTEPLTDAEIKTLDNAGISEKLKKYNINIDAINGSFEKKTMNLS